MNKKIKVIELLNMMANKEKLPKKIELCGDLYEWIKAHEEYRDEKNQCIGNNLILERCLQDEVEILEYEEEIDIQEIGELPEDFDVSFYDKHSIKANRYKINEILRAAKQLDKKIRGIKID